MKWITTPRKLLRAGKMGIIIGAIIILVMALLPIIFPYASLGFSGALLIFVSFIQIILGVVNVSKGRKLLLQGANIDQPVDSREQVAEYTQFQVKLCPSCGARIPFEARFCPQCQLKQDEAIINLAAELQEADAEDLKILSDMGIKSLMDLAEEDPAELSTILDLPIETVRLWIDRAQTRKNGITFEKNA